MFDSFHVVLVGGRGVCRRFASVVFDDFVGHLSVRSDEIASYPNAAIGEWRRRRPTYRSHKPQLMNMDFWRGISIGKPEWDLCVVRDCRLAEYGKHAFDEI